MGSWDGNPSSILTATNRCIVESGLVNVRLAIGELREIESVLDGVNPEDHSSKQAATVRGIVEYRVKKAAARIKQLQDMLKREDGS
jgi:hypothetical protein